MCAGNCGNCESCSENILTSEIISDVQFNNIVVPAGSDLNDVLLLLEAYVDASTQSVTLTITEPNNLGLAAGTYSMQQVVNAINDALGTINDIVITEPNNLGLAANTYSTQDVIDAINTKFGTLDSSIQSLEDDSTALQAITPLTVQRLKINLTQTGTNEPTIDETFIDDFGGVFSYDSVGTFYYTKNGAFPDADKIFITLCNRIDSANGNVKIDRDTNNRLIINSSVTTDTAGVGTNTLTNGVITKMSLLIEVYP